MAKRQKTNYFLRIKSRKGRKEKKTRKKILAFLQIVQENEIILMVIYLAEI